MNITERLVDHCLSIEFRKLPSNVIEHCKILLLDFVGLPVKASNLESSKSLYAAVTKLASGGECTAIPHGRYFLPQYAAFINGAYGHSLDYDDTHRESSIHPGVSVIPSILAMGEIFGADGKKIVEAMVAGYDVACRLGMAINPKEHYARGFHGTGTCGVFGATVAAGLIADINYDELLNAFGINISQVAGSMQFLENGSWNKRFHPGFAAHNAILAVYLAKSGFIGAAKPIEGKYGFLSSYSQNTNAERILTDLGERYEIVYTGIKPYPCCRYIHPAVDLLLELKDELDHKMVEEIVVEMTNAGYRIVGEPLKKKQNPKNVVDAQFSMPFALATAIVKKRLTVSEFVAENLENEEIRGLMQKIIVKHNPELDKEYPVKWPVVLKIKTNGNSYELRKDYPKGEPEDPISFEEVAEKFKSLAAEKFSEDQINEIIKIIKRLDKISDVRDLTDVLTVDFNKAS